MEEEIKKLEEEIAFLKARNDRVEGDKAWETSMLRKLFICAITYIFAALLMSLIKVDKYLLGALVPVLGYFLSTQSLPLLKKWWLSRRE